MSDLPKGWVRPRLVDVGTIVTGNTPPRRNPKSYGKDYPWVKPGDLDSNKAITETEEYLSEYGSKKARLLPPGTTLVSCIGLLGKVGYAGTTLATNQQINSVIFNKEIVFSKYGFYYCKTLKKWLEKNASATTVSIINKSRLSEAPFLLPPLNEQRRIVAKLEKLLNKVDACKERLGEIPIILKRFRQSVLAAACSGRLTADWREKNPDVELASELLKRIQEERKKKGINNPEITHLESDVLPNTWVNTKISAVYDINPGHKGMKIDDNLDVSFVPMNMIEEETGVIRTGTFRRYKEVKGNYTKFIEDDILFAKITPCMENGKIAIAKNLSNGIGCGTTELHVFRPVLRGTNTFLFYFLLQKEIREMAKNRFQGTSGHLRVPVDFFEDIEFPLPPFPEQREIVRRVEALFKVADQIEGRYKKAKAYVDKLKQSILGKAFRGELVPQDPNDVPASVLLERIREERAEQHRKSQTRKTRTRRRQRPQNQLEIDI